MKTHEEPQRQAAQPGGLPAATGYAPESRTKLIRLVVIRPYTRRAIGLWAPIGSHTRSTKIMNYRLGKKRAWTFGIKSPHTGDSATTL